ncbi:MAG: ubiquinone/menaquinone biosynthesis C-methylase UbiE, partial [Halieaceae bacterium]
MTLAVQLPMTENALMKVDPWTLYWQSDKLESCIAMASADDAMEIAAYWQAFALQLNDLATVLDLASGNGAVPIVMLAENPGLKFVAVDKAEIEPPKYLSRAKELAAVQFFAGVDICNLPFEDESFDAVTSQFGLEYAPLASASESAARVLKKSGAMRLLMHHVDSEIVRPSAQILREITDLLVAGGVVEKVGLFATHQISLEQLEAVGQQYLQTETPKTERVSG